MEFIDQQPDPEEEKKEEPPTADPNKPMTKEERAEEMKKMIDKKVANSYLDYFKATPLKDLVYLTADSPNEISCLDPTKVYIIGGIVDRNRYKKLTYNKAEKQGISHASLPIRKFMKLTTSAVLTVNHVFEIMAK